MLLFHSHKQKLAATAAVLAFATMLCYVMFTFILNTLDNPARGRSAPPYNKVFFSMPIKSKVCIQTLQKSQDMHKIRFSV